MVSTIIPKVRFLECLIMVHSCNNAISVCFLKSIIEGIHRLDTLKSKSDAFIKNEENKIVPTKPLMFNVLVGEV